ncbi:hypothetical protein HDU85_003930 [Gaertneriomyces sp. JEL0708]|nr:hypothetical protein HDU85_003930 [Gaertneriomyces sp. JEL0708]
MVSDFFYPNMGGVEEHIYHLSQRLVARGHKVIILTHAYSSRVGVRHLISGVKVYHIPHWLVTDQVSLPTVYSFFPLLRWICVRESVDVVHGHGAFSSMSHESILHAGTLGIPSVFTDHSLFGFENGSSILTNKLLKFTLSDVGHCICVSHTSKENTVLRASLNPLSVSVIPNAVVASDFTPDPSRQKPGRITIVVAARLVYRKGVDLLLALIPKVCQAYDDVDFLIAGSGPYVEPLGQLLDMHDLHHRVTLLGQVDHAKMRDVLTQGHIFLNTSLTEAFCIAVVEAACCGLLVVSTAVGGLPEVLPSTTIDASSGNLFSAQAGQRDERPLLLLSPPSSSGLLRALHSAINTMKEDPPDPWETHRKVKGMYDWTDVSIRTEAVYETVLDQPRPDLIERMRRFLSIGPVAGVISVMIIVVDVWLLWALDYLVPRETIERARNWDPERMLAVLGADAGNNKFGEVH